MWNESSLKPPEPSSPQDSSSLKRPLGLYFMATVSGLFVTVGFMLIVAFSHLFFGKWIQNAPKWVLGAIPVTAVALGFLSGWQTALSHNPNMSWLARPR